MAKVKILNNWDTKNERIYKLLSPNHKERMDKLMLRELELNIPIKRKSFEALFREEFNPSGISSLLSIVEINEMQEQLLRMEINYFYK
jgi:hypothetical protein